MTDFRVNEIFDLDPTESIFSNLLHPWRLEPTSGAPQIRLDVSESEDRYVVKADIPGARKEDIDVRIDGNHVTISAQVNQERNEKSGSRMLRSERKHGSACRKFALAENVGDAESEAKFENGVLMLTLSKGASASEKRLTIA
ncbi:MAG: Hsp20/alpha crystallin family protein [Burkholderiaceae bacterium]|nr:Hsp20/alpha crystallin family protein [Burkholderiaceae bacterium]